MNKSSAITAIKIFQPTVITHFYFLSQKDGLVFIQAVVHEHWDKGRTQISKILCLKWNWTQPNGRLKDMACREVLLTLH